MSPRFPMEDDLQNIVLRLRDLKSHWNIIFVFFSLTRSCLASVHVIPTSIIRFCGCNSLYNVMLPCPLIESKPYLFIWKQDGLPLPTSGLYLHGGLYSIDILFFLAMTSFQNSLQPSPDRHPVLDRSLSGPV